MIISESENPAIKYVPPEFGFGTFEIEVWQYVLFLIAVVTVIALTLAIIGNVASRRNERLAFSTRDISYGAICLSMSFVLSFIGFSLLQGGTITLASILPVSIYCYYFGYRKGAVVTSIFMLLQFLQNPYILNAWGTLLDYVIPYFALSLTGAFVWMDKHAKSSASSFVLFRHKGYFIGLLAYVLIRYFCHVLSGVVFYADYAPENLSPLVYSLSYNSFCFADTFIAAAAALGLLASKNFTLLMTRSVKSANAGMAAESDGLSNTDSSTKNH